MSRTNLTKTTDGLEPEGDTTLAVPRPVTDSSQPRTENVERSAEGPPLLSVVVPAYNEAESVTRTVDHIVSVVSDASESDEIIVVDDGSDDGTLEELRSLAEDVSQVECVSYEENQGKGHAVKMGCRQASGEFVLFVDADGDLTPERITTFLDRMRTTDADVVIGSKRHPDSDVTYPLKRRILSKGYSLLIRVLFGLKVTDTQVGMKLLRGEVVDDVMPLVLVRRYAFDVELLALAHSRGYVIVEAPVSLEFDGASNVDWSEIGRIAIDTARVFCRLHLLESYDMIERSVLQYVRESKPRIVVKRSEE